MDGKDNSGTFKNLAYEAEFPPAYGVPVIQQPTVVAYPPPETQGIFLGNDEPVIVQPFSTDAPPIGPEATLNYLKNVTKLHIKQRIELIEIVIGFDTANRFTISDENNKVLFYALESSNCLIRQFCGPPRPFKMKILDIYQNEVMLVDRPLACQCCICYCCLMNVEVSCPRGNLVGKVQQEFSLLYPKFSIENRVGETILQIDGPCWTCSCGDDIIFKVSTPEYKEVAEITKNWSGMCQEFLTDADNFTVTFERDLDPALKATVLGAVFLLDVMYFERKK